MNEPACQMCYVPELGGTAPVVEFSNLIPTPGNPFPVTRVKKVICVGPFVRKTDGAFETEYLYERHKTLDCDYLEGGEANVRPFLGKKEKNAYIGPAEFTWVESQHTWEKMEFFETTDTVANEDLLYATPQRNCIFYAAAYVRCRGEQEAVICYESSGSQLFLNGQLIDDQPYGRMRGQATLGHQVAVRFRDGLNLVMFKVRVGFIADAMDISISNFSIHPLMVKCKNLGIAYPIPTDAYLGDEEQTRLMTYAMAGAFGDTENAEFTYTAPEYQQTISIPAMKAGQGTVLRLGIPAPKEGKALVTLRGTLRCGADLDNEKNAAASQTASCTFEGETAAYNGFFGTQHVLSDFHFDTTYHEEQRTYALGAFHIASNIMKKMRLDPKVTGALSEVDYLHPFYCLFIKDRELLRESFASGRVEADCFYNQPNELTSSAEGLARNVIYGQKYHKEYMGQQELVYSPGDVFGHPNQMSQLCAKGETISCRWGKPMMGLDAVFRHMSPDGTALLHTKTYVTPDEAIRLHLNHCEAPGFTLTENLPSFTIDGGMPWQEESASHACYSSLSAFQNGVEEDDRAWEEKTGRPALQVISNDMTQHHSGVLLTRSDFKQGNRLAENLLVSAEKFAAIAALYGAEYPERTLDKAWRQVVCGQHHDSVTGTNNEISFIDLMLEYREAVELAAGVLENAMKALASKIDAPAGENPFVVFNPHPWDRTEPCYVNLPGEGNWIARDDAGKEYPVTAAGYGADGSRLGSFLADAPALGYKAYVLTAASRNSAAAENACTAAEQTDRNTIENEFFRLTVDPAQGGGIVSLWDKNAQREVIAQGSDGPANRIAVLKESTERLEGQHEFYTSGHKMFSSDYRAKVSREITSNYERLNIVLRMDTMGKVRQQITLWKGVPRVDMRVIVEDYQDSNDLFTVTFPVNVKNGRAVYDDRFAPHVTSKSLNKLSFQTHTCLTYSQCRVSPVNQWIDLGPTVALDLGGQGVLQAGMTAIIRKEGGKALGAADMILEALTKKAIPVSLYPEGEQHGRMKYINFNEDLSTTDMRIVLQLMDEPVSDYAKALHGCLSSQKLREMEQTARDAGAAVLYCVDDDNMLGKPLDVLLVTARDQKALENWAQTLSRQLAEGHRVYLENVFCADSCPAEDDYGVALLNNGNIACSVEGENMLNLMLFHTADFYGNRGRVTGAGQLIPEQKTFSASYSMYPHAHSYREARVYQKAMEFNDPLMSTAGRSKTGAVSADNSDSAGAARLLPTQKSFLRCPDSFLLTCFKAGGYDMAVMSQKKRSIAERGIAFRGFEVEGKAENISFEVGFDIEKAARVNLLENGGEQLVVYGEKGANGFAAEVGSHAIETFALQPVLDEQPVWEQQTALAPEAEVCQPVYVRSWEHDRGSMPLGYLSVAGVIGRKVNHISPTELSLTVSMANNQPDADAKGTIHLSASENLTLNIEEIRYDLAPYAAGEWELTIQKNAPDAEGILRMEYEDMGQRFEDTFEIGYFEPEMTIADRGEELVVTITNKTKQYLAGELELASPIETWDIPFNPHAVGSLPVGQIRVELAPGDRKEYIFPWKTLPGREIEAGSFDHMRYSFWAVAKLMMNGHIFFAYTHRKGEKHICSTYDYTGRIAADNGSVRCLYEHFLT